MALTYRKTKGSALTIDELDANFAYFTGSHPINGDLTITGSLIVSGSANSVFDIFIIKIMANIPIWPGSSSFFPRKYTFWILR
jgi:hypothetical protein